MVVKVSTDKVSEETAPASTVEIMLVAHRRYLFRGNIYEAENSYLVSEKDSKVLLAKTTDMGQPIFLRKEMVMKAKKSPVKEESGVVDRSDMNLIAGMKKDSARKAFNLTEKEDEQLAKELAARDAAEGNDEGDSVEV